MKLTRTKRHVRWADFPVVDDPWDEYNIDDVLRRPPSTELGAPPDLPSFSYVRVDLGVLDRLSDRREPGLPGAVIIDLADLCRSSQGAAPCGGPVTPGVGLTYWHPWQPLHHELNVLSWWLRPFKEMPLPCVVTMCQLPELRRLWHKCLQAGQEEDRLWFDAVEAYDAWQKLQSACRRAAELAGGAPADTDLQQCLVTSEPSEAAHVSIWSERLPLVSPIEATPVAFPGLAWMSYWSLRHEDWLHLPGYVKGVPKPRRLRRGIPTHWVPPVDRTPFD